MFTADFNPVAFQIGGLAIHWYALAYIGGFLGGVSLLKHLIYKRTLPLDPRLIDDFLTYAIIGVLLGGRIGYVLFYDLPVFMQHPLNILKVWQGGMSFHGGLLGVIGAVLLFSHNRKINPFAFGDLIAVAAPLGLLLGRITNFINGELWGRPTSLPWGVIFPHAPDLLPRHPSQLYEAGLEGLLLFIIMLLLAYKTALIYRTGKLSGIFLMGYATARFLVEFVREPDAQLGFIIGHTSMGQILCIPMFLFGLLIYLRLERHNTAHGSKLN